ncbi:O-antigen ligase family protein [Microbacterium sp. 1P10AE]|uniref:O-antigen ligase family protein n=1 Tax=Microbacterium sp. 1P10AE TaxID=3132286 RepID=UPI0039A3CE8F
MSVSREVHLGAGGPPLGNPPQKFAEFALSIALVIAVFQFQEVLPFAPLSLWWLLLAIPALLGAPNPRWPAVAALTLALANVVVSFWSLIPLEAIRMSANFVGLSVSAALTARILKGSLLNLSRPLAIAAPALAIQSGLTILFFMRPDIEQLYFDWQYSTYFSGAGVKLLFTTGFNNVVFPEKSGGFFLNGNTASMFMAMSAWLYFGLGARTNRKWMMWFSLVPFVGAIGTGSKTALLLAGTSVLVVALLTVVRKSIIAGAAVAMLLPLVGLFALSALSSAQAFSQDTSNTVGSRGRIWELAAAAISRNSVTGLGYGGWREYFRQEGGFIGFDERPAHNFLIQAWLDGGIVYLALISMFAIVSVGSGLVAVRRASGVRDALASASVLMSVTWVFVHGLADNTWVYGDWHSLPFFGVALTILASWSASPTLEPRSGSASEAVQSAQAKNTHAPDGRDTSGIKRSQSRTCGEDCPFEHQTVSG